MKDYFTYKIIPELKLIIEFGYGILNYENGLSFKLKESQDKDFNSTFNFLVVYTHLKIQYTKEDIAHYVDILKEHKEIVGNRKSAMLTDTPNQVVFNYMYRTALKEFAMTFEIFSSLSAALDWLGVPIESESTINNLIEDWVKYATQLNQ